MLRLRDELARPLLLPSEAGARHATACAGTAPSAEPIVVGLRALIASRIGHDSEAIHLSELANALELHDVTRAAAVARAATERADAAGDEAGAALLRTVTGNMQLNAGECYADELEELLRL